MVIHMIRVVGGGGGVRGRGCGKSLYVPAGMGELVVAKVTEREREREMLYHHQGGHSIIVA